MVKIIRKTFTQSDFYNRRHNTLLNPGAGLLPQGTYGIAISGELTEEAWTLGGESAEATVFATFAIR